MLGQGDDPFGGGDDPFGAAGSDTAKEEGASEPLDEDAQAIEKLISEQVQKLANEERERRLEYMQIVMDDIIRLCRLGEPEQGRLELAAKGATKRSMERWHEQADRYFRNRVQDTDPATAQEILGNIGGVTFSGRASEGDSEVEELWKEALSAALTEAQLHTYETVVEERSRARIHSFAQMSLATIDDYLRLTPEQREQIGEIVHDSATNYLDQIQKYWGEYLQKGMLMSLANAADEETLAEILSEAQHARLKSATSSLDHFWKQRHKARKEEEEKRKKEAEAQDKAATPQAAAPEPAAVGEGPIAGDAEAEAVPVAGGGRVRIKAGGEGAVIIRPGAIFKGGDVIIEGKEIHIEGDIQVE